ncbi:MAG: lysophospholipid acyltransferase family protein [Candidatus Omnitrophica bacterium]|nr:lysophospholipid acyltransferase family protein [Candidatus Omnitrophota bacterium]
MFNYTLYRIGQFLALSLPLGIAYKVCIFISDLHYLFARKDRRSITENLKAIFPGKTDKEIRNIRVRVFRNFAKYLVDFFRFSKIDEEYITKNIKIEHINYLDEALSRGKGVIVLTAHVGNWELGGVVVSLLGYPFWAVALTHKDKKVDKFFNFQRQSKGVKVIPLKNAVKMSLDALKKGELVALVGDRDFTEKGAMVEFFGKPALLPVGPAALSLKTGASIVPGFMLRNDDDTFTLKFSKPFNFQPSGNKNEDLQAIMEQYKAIFEDCIRGYPDQWYMFRKFWLEQKK